MKKYSIIIGVIVLAMIFVGAIFLNEISHADDSFTDTSSKKVVQPQKVVKHIPDKKEAVHRVIPKENKPVTPVPSKEKEETKPTMEQAVMYTAVPSKDKIVALTFDDGPDKKYTKQVLDILEENQIKATFFVIGKNIKEYPNAMKEIVAGGHAVGVHTWSHANLTKLTASGIKTEMEQTSKLLKDDLGVETNFMRPPFGAMDDRTLQILADLGFYTIKWSVDTRDWAGTTSNVIIQNVNGNVKPGGIVLQHSAGGKGGNLDNTIKALPIIIKDLKAKGYQFVTVPEMLQIAQ